MDRVDGRRYFHSRPLYASFVKPDKVTAGEFPPLDLDLDDDEMEM